jgi:hypothetical protein
MRLPFIADLARRARNDRRGVAAVMTAMLAPALIGAVGLAVDVTLWQISQSKMQGAADVAAWAGSLEYFAGGSANAQTWARAVAGQNGYVTGVGGVTVTVNQPPVGGTHTTASGGVEVIISQAQSRWLSKMFLSAGPSETARAVVGSTASAVTACMASLDANANDTALSISGSGNVLNLSGCSYANNSASVNSVSVDGTTDSFSAASATLAGGYSANTGGGDSFCTSPAACNPLKTNTATAGTNPNDPYANKTIPTAGSCSSLPTFNAQNTATVTGGATYCSSLTMTTNKNLTLSNGVYIFDKTSLIVQNSTITLNNATIVFTASSGTIYGNLSISGASTASLTAPTTGATSGIAVWMDKRAASTNSVAIGGAVALTQAGAIYAPSAQTKITGGVTGTCAAIFSSQIIITGSSSNLSYTPSCNTGGGGGGGGGGATTIGFLE